MAPQNGGGGGVDKDGIDHQSAKHVLDSIGKIVHDKVKKEVEQRSNGELKGKLSLAKFENVPSDKKAPSDPCELKHEYRTNATNGTSYPCRAGKEERFSDTLGGQCTDSKMRSDGIGACAPYRRLHLCSHNLESIDTTSTTHDLLAEVCMAAKYEGDLIKTHYTIHKQTNNDSASQLCTVLARSFADIGDIVRGRDLYRGGGRGRKQLEENLQKIFENIKNTNSRLIDLTDDQIREYWWELNREMVWRAITCGVKGSQYFRPTCGINDSWTGDDCRCTIHGVPTYFDYVPQYLRWFEEWAEDFCRKKKIKVENVKKSCRGKDKNNEERYCSRNGFDCEKTVNARGKLRYGKQCTDCFFACNPYVDWIDKKKEEFDKQKQRYENVIKRKSSSDSGNGRQKRDAGGTTNYEGYEKKFYKVLQSNEYGTVNKFLEKLSNEEVCKEVKDNDGGTIHFENVKSSSTSASDSGTNNENEGTFYRSDYCQPCPFCGMKKESNGNFVKKSETDECKRGNLYNPTNGAKPTEIKILISGKGHKDIEKKLEAFCEEKNGGGGSGVAAGSVAGGRGGSKSDSKELYEEWKCYKHDEVQKVNVQDDDEDDDGKYVENGGGLCILPNPKKKEKESDANSEKEPDKIQKTFHDFFYYWVAHMLKDSIHWRTKKLEKCLENNNGNRCRKGCIKNCKCFLQWVAQKKEEWDPIKKQFRKQDISGTGGNGNHVGFIAFSNDGVLEDVLKLEFYKDNSENNSEENTQNSLDAEEAKELKHIREIIESEDKNQETSVGASDGKKKTIMDKLIDYEKDEAEECLEIHEDEEEGGENDECDADHEELPIMRSNPCATPSGSRHRALANKVAHQMHKAAKTQLRNRGGRKALKGDASQGHYARGGSREHFKDICKITKKDSNDIRRDGEPCYGKDGGRVRMKIGTPWSKVGEDKTTYSDVFLPPRREHMCTSNLENLDVGSVTKKDKVIHSLLGDVLLSAKMDAEEIIKRYKEQNNITSKIEQKDEEAICRAVKYSFADLGDIIRGRDMWDKDVGMQKLEPNLKNIFENIKEKNPNIKSKYTDDDNGKYTKLREDWWSANRIKIWSAMKCALKSDNIQCRMTPDDYIPQRLRWLTEWAEWFCKMQKDAYEELKRKCGECQKKGESCWNGDETCKACDNQCKLYGDKIKQWEQQWNEISAKYIFLYLQAKNDARYSLPIGYGDSSDQQVVHFFKELQKTIRSSSSKRSKRSLPRDKTTPYSTPAGYIHQEVPHMECQVQNQFCEKKHGETSTSTTKENKEYTFKKPPPEYKDACGCEGRTAPVPPKKKEDACEMVKALIGDNDGKQPIENCNPKEYNNQPYPDWDCEKNIDSNNIGACMPPRRQKLCLYYLKELSNDAKEYNLREAFIKTAAAETFLSWSYYKNKNGNGKDLDEELKKGKIPEEFLRSMFFTYGDYRDICLNTDISLKQGDVLTANDKIEKILPKKGDQTDHENRKNFWDENGPKIWEAMLCALEKIANNKTIKSTYNYKTVTFSGNNSTTLEDFAKTPQFLRWMTEWAEDFCKQRDVKVKELMGECTGCTLGIDGKTCNNESRCDACKKKCKEYEGWLQTWKGHYNKQNQRYTEVKGTSPYKEDSDVKESKEAYEYLGKKLKNITCTSGSNIVYCNCMEETLSTNASSEKMPASLEYPPIEIEGKCDCQEKEATRAPAGPQVNVCDTVKNALEGNLDDACRQKYSGNNSRLGWKCIPTSGAVTTATPSNSGSICIPPRRRKLYLGGFDKFISGSNTVVGGQAQTPQVGAASTSTSQTSLLLDAFVKSAAIETFFLWHKYKTVKQKELDEKKKQQQENDGLLDLGDDKDPQTELNGGTIPEEFKRQMFYTLGDYRDILFSGRKDEKSRDRDIFSGDKEIAQREKEIKNAIEKYFKKIGEQAARDDQSSGSTQTQPSEKKREQFWKQHGKHIWEGMIYALTYDTNSGTKETPPTQNEKVKQALWEEAKKQPKKDKDHDYTYENVVLKEENSGTGDPKPQKPPTSGEKTTLVDFISRPTYFRYLEEWGQNFCKERKKRLEKIEGDCRVEDGSKNCSGYGEHCDDQLEDNPSTVPSLKCQSCGEECRKYKKWIERKKYEFTEQQNAYGEQKKNCPTQSKAAGRNNDGNEFYKNLQEKYNDTAEFLHKLGPCSKNNNTEEDKIEFDKPDNTFKTAKNCDPCSQFKIDCKKAKCSNGDDTNVGCTGSNGKKNGNGYITSDHIENGGNSTHKLDMLVSDDSTKEFKGGLNDSCKDADIFKGIKENKWSCRNVCGYVVCKPENGNGKNVKVQNGNDKHIITIRALLHRWVEYFLDDYKKIKHKISHCINNGEGNICKKDCQNKCNCVEKWVEKKRGEWGKIKNRLLDQYKYQGQPDYPVTTILEDLQSQIDATINKAIKPCDLTHFKKSCGLNGSESSQKKGDTPKDIVECLLTKLEDKAKECKEDQKPNGENPETKSQNTHHVGDEDDDPLEEENQVDPPKICPQTPAQQEETDDKCGGTEEKKDEKKEESAAAPSEETETNQNPEEKPEEEAQAPKVPKPPKPKPPRPKTPTQLLDNPHVQTALMSSTIMWSVGIGFAAFTYFYLKVLNIYIGKYRGKRYIYLEGDSGTDSGYTDHYSDITSSSESEYEEMDINDIYAPRAPKYKTLIEVVLEPSKSNGNTLGDDMVPTTNTFTDEEWNQLKDDFISQYLPNTEPNNNYRSGNSPTNTNNTTTSHDNMGEKPFITSIHDRNLYTGEEISYNINMSTNTNNDIPKYVSNNVYSGIDLINDTLSGNQHIDIYDELLKRKENELFGTNNPKRTSIHSVAKLTNSDPIHNQLELFHTWLDRHRDMCEKWNNKEEVLNKLKEEWENETHSGNTHPSDSNKTLNTDVSIQIHMDNPKPINQFTNMDTILEDLDKYNEPYYDVQDDIYYDVNDDHDTSTVDSNAMDVPSKVQIEMDVNTKLVKEKYPIADVWDI
ncbi:hypothetical protein C923_03709 [Plasmodium falciparum UGT5.1]|uniref:Duffy-binding-like domain-containing protein n=1 Tax=Plasmodium falciparum UGT5.1 TaxID=1237627 RepID=W7JL70_PLAFA|nr:hypothetical protein C923_03709 [Plasmodium falciparum UGT5.1]